MFGGTAYGSAVFIINNANNVTILGDQMDNPAEFYNNQASIEGTGKSGTNFLYYKGDFPAIQVYTTGTQPLYTNWFQTFNVGQLYGNINNATNYDITKLNPANLVTKTIVGYIGVDASGAIGTNTPAGGTGNGNASTNNATVQYWSGIQNLTNVSNTYAGNANSLTNGNAVASISGPMLITNGPTGTVVPSYNGSLLTNGNAVVSAAGPMMMTNGTGQLVPTYNGSSLTNLNITGASGTFTGTVIATNFAVSSNNVAPTAASPTNGQFWFDGTDVYIYWTNFTTGLSGTNRIATMKSVPTAGQGVAYDSVNKTFYPTNINTFTTLSNAGPTIATFTSSTNTYSGVYVQNQSGGTNASGEVGAIANNGTTTSFSTFFGINNGGFSNPSLPPTGTNTAYWLFFGNASNAAASFGGSGKIYGPQTNAQLAIIMGGGTNAAGSESWTNMIVDTNGVSIGWPFKLSGNGSGLTNISASATNIGVITITNVNAQVIIASTNGQGVAGGNQFGFSLNADTNAMITITDTNAGATGGGTNPDRDDWKYRIAKHGSQSGWRNQCRCCHGRNGWRGINQLDYHMDKLIHRTKQSIWRVLPSRPGTWDGEGWVSFATANTTIMTNAVAGIEHNRIDACLHGRIGHRLATWRIRSRMALNTP